MTLDDHLHACVRETNHVKGSVGARATLRAAIQADRAFHDAARAKLAELVPAITDKCFIARTQKAALEEVLR